MPPPAAPASLWQSVRRVLIPGPPRGSEPMTFLGHLMELRRRLWICIITVIVCVTVALVFTKEIFSVLRQPLKDLNAKYAASAEYQANLKAHGFPANEPVVKLQSIDPVALMTFVMWVGVYAGLALSSPMIIYQMWMFVAPGLREKEKRAVRPMLWTGVLFFMGGCAICYYYLFPVCFEFFTWLAVDLEIQQNYQADIYISLLTSMMAMCGLVCETPLLAAVFAKLGLIKPSYLTRFWRPIVFGGFAAGAAISPGSDIMLMMIFSGLILSVYFLSILAAYLFYPRGRDAGTSPSA